MVYIKLLMSLHFRYNFTDNRKRKRLQNNEIFFKCCFLLQQAKFSNRLKYFFFISRKSNIFLTKIRNRCVVSGYSRSVSKFKLSRHSFSQAILSGSMPGFFRAVW